MSLESIIDTIKEQLKEAAEEIMTYKTAAEETLIGINYMMAYNPTGPSHVPLQAGINLYTEAITRANAALSAITSGTGNILNSFTDLTDIGYPDLPNIPVEQEVIDDLTSDDGLIHKGMPHFVLKGASSVKKEDVSEEEPIR